MRCTSQGGSGSNNLVNFHPTILLWKLRKNVSAAGTQMTNPKFGQVGHAQDDELRQYYPPWAKHRTAPLNRSLLASHSILLPLTSYLYVGKHVRNTAHDLAVLSGWLLRSSTLVLLIPSGLGLHIEAGFHFFYSFPFAQSFRIFLGFYSWIVFRDPTKKLIC